MSQEIHHLLRPENRSKLMQEAMQRIDELQKQVIEQANKMIPDLKEFEQKQLKIYNEILNSDSTKKMIEDAEKSKKLYDEKLQP